MLDIGGFIYATQSRPYSTRNHAQVFNAFKVFCNSSGFRRFKELIQASRRMKIQVVSHKNNDNCLGLIFVGQTIQKFCEIQPNSSISEVYTAPANQRSNDREHICCAISFS